MVQLLGLQYNLQLWSYIVEVVQATLFYANNITTDDAWYEDETTCHTHLTQAPRPRLQGIDDLLPSRTERSFFLSFFLFWPRNLARIRSLRFWRLVAVPAVWLKLGSSSFGSVSLEVMNHKQIRVSGNQHRPCWRILLGDLDHPLD